MDTATAQRALQAAQAALQQGRPAEARGLLAALRKALPRERAVLYLSARLARSEGDPRGAAKLFEKALRASPREASLWAEYASTLDDAGRPEEAVKAYDRALQLEPRLVDAAIDRAVLQVRKLDRPAKIEDLRRIARDNPAHLRCWRNLAMLEREAFATEQAITAADHVLAAAPGDASALATRAFAQFDSGEPSADYFARACAADPGNAALATKYAAALHGEGRSEDGDRLLGQILASQPFHLDALRTRAQLRWEAALGGDPMEGFEQAVARPGCPPEIWREYARLIERQSGAEAALEIVKRARASLGNTRDVALMAAQAACEADDFAEREDAIAAVADWKDPYADMLRARWLARMHRWDELATLGQRLLRAGLQRDILPYLSLAWRGSDPERWHWLERDGNLVGALDISSRLKDIEALAGYLRSIHQSQRQPLEQSLRGGTQTDGMLFARTAPEIVELKAAIEDAVRDYLAGLPPRDPKHPWLSLPREIKRFSGAWSVRLQDAGFHVAHIHNLGDVSSACYIALPETLGADGNGTDGWLAVGEPPREFGLDWGPVRLIEPEVGRLALFPSWAWHGTRPFTAGERLTVAFDVALR